MLPIYSMPTLLHIQKLMWFEHIWKANSEISAAFVQCALAYYTPLCALQASPKIVFLFDPAGTRTGLPQVPRAFTIVFASTFEGNFGCIAKAIHVRLYMPVWSLKELQACVDTRGFDALFSLASNNLVLIHSYGETARVIYPQLPPNELSVWNCLTVA